MKEPVLPLDQRLVERPYEFDFHQAVRLLDLILADRPGVGEPVKPSEEIARFKVRQSLEFPASAIHTLDIERDPARMVVTFFGLTGVQGVLPHHYTEHIIARAMVKDFAMAEFLDLFNHRLISLFYRAWERHRFPVLYQKGAIKASGTDRFTQYCYDLIGLGTIGLRRRLHIPDQALLRYAGLFAQVPRCASALRGIIRDHFGIPVDIEEYRGVWHEIDEDDRCDLDGQGSCNQLGVGAIAGDAVWDPQACFRVRLGPLCLVRFLAFLPGTDAVRDLEELVRFYVGDVLQCEWQLILRAEEVPWCRLGDESPAGPRLGWCAWLKTDEFESDPGDAVFAAGG